MKTQIKINLLGDLRIARNFTSTRQNSLRRGHFEAISVLYAIRGPAAPRATDRTAHRWTYQLFLWFKCVKNHTHLILCWFRTFNPGMLYSDCYTTFSIYVKNTPNSFSSKRCLKVPYDKLPTLISRIITDLSSARENSDDPLGSLLFLDVVFKFSPIFCQIGLIILSD